MILPTNGTNKKQTCNLHTRRKNIRVIRRQNFFIRAELELLVYFVPDK
jgi:hypothetical protein